MAEGLTEEQQDEYKEAWAEFDKSGGAAFQSKQLGFLMRYLGQNPTEVELQDYIAKYGSGGGMPQSGFLAMMADKTRDVETEDGVIEAFQVFDKDGKGQISAAELRSVLTNMGDKLNDEQVAQMMREALASDEGNLNYRDFVHMMMNR